MVSRRQVLVSGGASLVLLGGGLAGYVGTRSIARAQQPWRDAAAGFGDARLDALAYAILAPNPHNRQPWQVRLDGEDRFTLYCDLEKRLPHTDPPNRQITIGFGTFLEAFRQAAAEKGYRTVITPFPEGEPQPVLDHRPIASVQIVPDPAVAKDPLFATILDRRSTKEPFAPRAVPEDQLNALRDLALANLTDRGLSLIATSDPDQVARLRDLTWEAWAVEYDVPRTQRESVDLMRIGAAEVNARPDGIDLSGPMMETLALTGIVSREKLATKGSQAYESGIAMYKTMLEETQSFAWLATADNSRVAQLHSGMAWMRLNQAANKNGLALHPVSQVLQEFPEMENLYTQFHDTVDMAEPSRVQGLFRVGYAALPEASPRWPVESFILNA